MKTLIEGSFVRFLKNLNVDPPTAFDLRRDELRVRECMSAEFRIVNTGICGSFARGTLIPPLNAVDVNILVSIEPSDFSRPAHTETLQRTLALLNRDFDFGQISRTGHAVNVSSGEYTMDVIPSFVHPDGGVLIPDANKSRWLRTDPDKHIEMWSEFDRAQDGRFIPLVQMLKAWNRFQGGRFSSFHLEARVREAFLQHQITDYPAAILHFFEHAHKHIVSPIADPAGFSGDVGEIPPSEMPQYLRLLSGSRTLMAAAIAINEQLMPAEAANRWRGIFGDSFPVD